MKPDTNVRIANLDDVDALATLIVAFRDHQGHNLPAEDQLLTMLRELIADKQTHFFLAGTPRDNYVGYLQQRYRLSLWTQALQADIEDLFVMPTSRQHGVGSSLIDFAVEHAKSRGCRQISVDTNELNLSAVALYEKCGFSAVSPRWDGGRRVLLRQRI